jgi:DNA-binding CsgD family transcriptional regulator
MDADIAHELLRDGRDALAAGEWDRARSCFERAGELAPSAEALDGLSQAVQFRGDHARAIELRERAFGAYRSVDKRVEAAEVARWLAFLHVSVHGNMSAANGWMARAERLLEGMEECPAHGWLTLDRAPFTDDASERARLALTALEIATRAGDRDLEVSALALLGNAYVALGRVAEGMTLLDETMAAVSGGEISGVGPIGEIYCRLLSACEHTGDVTRAEQWLAAAGASAAWTDFVPPACKVHYGGILIATGRWAEAEAELLDAVDMFEHGHRAQRSSAVTRLAELRVRQGRFEEAERLLEEHGWDAAARRVLATVALGRGDLPLAEDRARLCLEEANPSDPAHGSVLELLVEVQLARADHDSAAATRDRLVRLAAECPSDRAAASAELVAGRVRAAEADERARSHLRAALERFSNLGLPLEAARARLELAAALAHEAPDAARAEARLALETFERLGAVRDADRGAALLRRLGAPGRSWRQRNGALSKRETEVLSLLAAGRSNVEIAERLYISRRTAEHHVANILSKLGLRRRAEAAAYVARSETLVAK